MGMQHTASCDGVNCDKSVTPAGKDVIADETWLILNIIQGPGVSTWNAHGQKDFMKLENFRYFCSWTCVASWAASDPVVAHKSTSWRAQN